MKATRAPKLEPRRALRFEAELFERARAWLPTWAGADNEQDFARALLKIAAGFSSEVAERLDGVGEKMRRGFLDWLAIRGEAARPARMPVVFKLADNAKGAVNAEAPVRMQVDSGGTPVVFETEKDVRVVPGRLEALVGVDGAKDAFYLPPPGLTSLDPLEPAPTEWRLKTSSGAGATTLQLDPEIGLAVEMVLKAAGKHYRITAVDKGKGIATIEPALEDDLTVGATVRKVQTFSPFDGITRDRQEHALYLGHTELLDVEAATTIAVVGAQSLKDGVTWQYWGKSEKHPEDDPDWQDLTFADSSKQQATAVVLEKPKGAVVAREIDAKNSRWIRAKKKVAATDQPFGADELGLLLNGTDCGKEVDCPASAETQGPAAEAMANTTPIVLGSTFFPLGKEPRQFDAFYLGSAEAFSKRGAEVQICFEMADPTFTTLTRLRGGLWNHVLAGVGRDRALHLFQFDAAGSLSKFRDREPLQPPLPGFMGKATSSNPVALDQEPAWRLPMWVENSTSDLLVGTTAGNDVWIWQEHGAVQNRSGWISFGQLPAAVSSTQDKVDGFVYLAAGALAPTQLAVLRSGQLFLRDRPEGSVWTPVNTVDAGNPVALNSIVAIGETGAGRLATSADLGMLGVTAGGQLYAVTIAGLCTPIVNDVDPAVRPIGIRRANGDQIIVFAQKSVPRIVTLHSVYGRSEASLPTGAQVLGFDVSLNAAGVLDFLATVRLDNADFLASWRPHTAIGAATQLFRADVQGGLGRAEGAPTEIAQHVIVPGTRGDVLVADFDVTQRRPRTADVSEGVVVPTVTVSLPIGAIVTLDSGPPFTVAHINGSGTTKDNEVFYPIDQVFPAGVTGVLYVFNQTAAPMTGDVDPVTATIALDANDHDTVVNALLLVGTTVHRVTAITPSMAGRAATLNPAPTVAIPNAHYRNAAAHGRLAPFMRLAPPSDEWDAALLDRAPLVFPGASPAEQKGKAFSVGLDSHPILVVLGQHWTAGPVPGVGASFVLDAVARSWSRLLGDTSTNPDLSWEYSNGKGWSSLGATDGTLNLKSTGILKFTVPDDLVASDWSGRTNVWIRARLIGGDYGREKITVKTTTTSPGVTEQTVTRSSEGIRAPSIVKLHITYRLCNAVRPTYVLAADSGSFRNQSDANKTDGAIVEAFVPLALKLGRLSKPGATASGSEECPPECETPPGSTGAGATSSAAPPTPAEPAVPATGRALFIGVKAQLSEAPVNVLLLVDERQHGQLAPVTVEALRGDHFVPIVATDATRALGESGIVSMTFAVPPTPWELFGQTLTWLRLTPSGTDTTKWNPAVKGAYLNAAWASATETLTRELVGSSDGAPRLRFFLARPPVLRDTLELRVKEPLGEEERTHLRASDRTVVLTDVENLTGDWVRWTRAIDPADEEPNARVYALDEANGEIRFGDGKHGMIPPIGRDSIVAFHYQRTEAGPVGATDVPGNAIEARTPLSLVTPVESVEAVVAADHAAGGAPPEVDERVLRFGTARLRHRERAVTTQDLEDLALESSPDIVQARCFVRPNRVQLVVVMRGPDPAPTAPQRRELHRLLLARAPVSLSVPHALEIVGPKIRRLRVRVELRVANLDHVGEVSRDVKQRIAALFDTAVGGTDGQGWALGADAKEDDVALALIDTQHIESLTEVTLLEIGADGVERAWVGGMKRAELVMLDRDPVRLDFETAEVLV